MKQILKHHAKHLRKQSTETENYLWDLLRNRNFNRYKFRRQHLIGNYIVDFVCIKKMLIIELDGAPHTKSRHNDEERTTFLNRKGYRVLRFWNSEVFKETEKILNNILLALEPSPGATRHPLPQPNSVVFNKHFLAGEG